MSVDRSVLDMFNLRGRCAVISGGGGFLGVKHCEAIAELGGTPVLLGLEEDTVGQAAETIAKRLGVPALGLHCDITQPEQVEAALARIHETLGKVDILINNAANNPRVEGGGGGHFSRLETMPLDQWNADIAVGLTGAMLCSRIFGADMVEQGRGSIINIGSEYGLIGPDQRIYRVSGTPDEQQLTKPVSYSVVKAGLLGLTRYLATYWGHCGVRTNVINFGGVQNGQDEMFSERLANLIPLGRMASRDEYKGAIAFLASDASSFMNGAVITVDGGRTCW